MTQLLHLDASARRRSFSRELSARFAERWLAAAPDTGYVHRDLAADPVPLIGEAWTEITDTLLAEGITDPADYPRAVRTGEQRAAWRIVEPLLAELLAADVVLIGTPMYNFAVPASLKAWIDQVTFPKMSLAPRSFMVVSSRGGAYGPGTPREPFDHQERYLRDFFAGHYDIHQATFISTELTNTLVDPGLVRRLDQYHESRTAALAEVDAAVDQLLAQHRRAA